MLLQVAHAGASVPLVSGKWWASGRTYVLRISFFNKYKISSIGQRPEDKYHERDARDR
jgi:hypothetical protein